MPHTAQGGKRRPPAFRQGLGEGPHVELVAPADLPRTRGRPTTRERQGAHLPPGPPERRSPQETGAAVPARQLSDHRAPSPCSGRDETVSRAVLKADPTCETMWPPDIALDPWKRAGTLRPESIYPRSSPTRAETCSSSMCRQARAPLRRGRAKPTGAGALERGSLVSSAVRSCASWRLRQSVDFMPASSSSSPAPQSRTSRCYSVLVRVKMKTLVTLSAQRWHVRLSGRLESETSIHLSFRTKWTEPTAT